MSQAQTEAAPSFMNDCEYSATGREFSQFRYAGFVRTFAVNLARAGLVDLVDLVDLFYLAPKYT